MEQGELIEQMARHLHSSGLDDKKLAVFLPNDSDEIAQQVCKDLGFICEQKHVDAVATLIKDVRSGEPFRKRLRGDDSLDPMHVQLLQELHDSLYPKSFA